MLIAVEGNQEEGRGDDRCNCREVQNTAHLKRCPVCDGWGRTVEEVWEDPVVQSGGGFPFITPSLGHFLPSGT